jgi:hypothetical protein
MNIVFIASVGLITRQGSATHDLLVRDLGLPLEPFSADPNYVFSEKIDGCKHFGLWPLNQAAEACFGTSEWPSERPVPQLSIEFEVDSETAVADAERELSARGYELLHPSRKEPWGQTICRLLTNEGAIVGVSYAPWLHAKT